MGFNSAFKGLMCVKILGVFFWSVFVNVWEQQARESARDVTHADIS